jgi:hypothetical protein
MLLTDDAFTRLCQARDLLKQIHETQPSIKQIAKEIHINSRRYSDSPRTSSAFSPASTTQSIC